MTRPTQGARLTGPYGNNSFAYIERQLMEPTPQIWLPSLQTISTLDEILLGTETVFCELDEKNSVVYMSGLLHIYELLPYTLPYVSCPVYVFDNHNYALYFRALQPGGPFPVVHIDQHSDLAPNSSLGIQEDIAHFVTHACTVGDFIRPALDTALIASCTWIKSQYDLEMYDLEGTINSSSYILDIDLDFRAPEMGTDLASTIPLVQQLMQQATLITIATSPYFLNQSYALAILKKLFA